MGDANEYKIKVIDKMFKIIDVVEQEKKPLGVNEIARKASLNAATTFRILRTLMDGGWIYQDQEEKYSPGYKLSTVFDMASFYFILKDVAYCVMRRLTDQEGEVLNLIIRQNETGVLLQQTRTMRFAEYLIQINSTLPLYATACGKVLLSELPEDLVRMLAGVITFEPYTKSTITTPDELLRVLAQTRERGYATDRGESIQGTSCIAVPVRSPSNEIIASLSFSGLLGELTDERELHYFSLLQAAAREISDRMFTLYTDKIPLMGKC